ncbi:MAG TPA: hypothetical protein VGX25_35440 [Actinophytocola sp.]|uniref:hypothetical protein n=1 Tax=Actinophytocola sp. TaxID=1872138 RepID=UPI002DDD18B7|nr:hypothetical protein [Actinophytocola sp.]HEV2784709.1 hypothetical protein [Actinophytocola sp.]
MAHTPGPPPAPRPEPMQWTVPVSVGAGQQRELVVTIAGGEVVLVPPPSGRCMLPEDSDAQLLEAVREARRVAREMRGWSS